MLSGINIAGNGFGPVGTNFNGVQQTAGMHLRASTATATGVTGNLQSKPRQRELRDVASILNVFELQHRVQSHVAANSGRRQWRVNAIQRLR